jgi:hypothetical protein
MLLPVIPAKAGIQSLLFETAADSESTSIYATRIKNEIPAFAGMTAKFYLAMRGGHS